MTVQISQRGKEYLKTAQSLLRTAETMTDQAIAAQLVGPTRDRPSAERRPERRSGRAVSARLRFGVPAHILQKKGEVRR